MFAFILTTSAKETIDLLLESGDTVLLCSDIKKTEHEVSCYFMNRGGGYSHATGEQRAFFKYGSRTIQVRQINHHRDVFDYAGLQYERIAFTDMPDISTHSVQYMASRVRASRHCDVLPCLIFQYSSLESMHEGRPVEKVAEALFEVHNG